MGLSEKVQAAVAPAIEMIESLIREILRRRRQSRHGRFQT